MVRTVEQARGGRGGPRGRLVAALAAGVLALVAACSDAGAPATEVPERAGGTESTPTGGGGGDQTGDSGEQTGDQDSETSGGAPAAVPEGLERFYGQELSWSECEGGECAQLQVPIDYEEPDGATIEIAVLRVAATGDRQGSLVVNPGGPGASGVDYAQLAGAAVDDVVLQAYDVVGFDPRGVARSSPITCFDDAQMDEFLGSDPTPDDAEEEAAALEQLEQFADACGENAGELLGHVSTVEAARDMDVLRAALGEDRLTYLGASYGTFLGATYAQLYPDRVGRFVLDGAIDPDLTSLEMGLGQAEGFERATRAYVEDCVAAGDCPLGDDVESAMEGIPAFLDELDANPIPLEEGSVPALTEGWGMYGIIVAMYDQAGWPLLTSALRDAQNGDGSMLMFLANLYADRTSDGDYNGNGMQAIYAVNCLDRPSESQLSSEEVLEQFEEVAPTWGRYLAGEGACQFWPEEAQTELTEYDAAGAPPILVIGTTRDPATPYEWAQGLAEDLESGVLISYDGDGHTAYGRSNDCVDDAVNAYLVDGTVPEDGLSC